MKKDAIKKQIDSLRDIRNHHWNALIVTIGGTIAITFNLNSIINGGLFLTGIILTFIFINGYFNKEAQINNLIKNLEKEK